VSVLFERVAVIGLGLLGGSVALAARQRGLAAKVVGATRSRDALAAALSLGMVDETAEPEAAVRGADLVILATPVFAMPETVRRIASALEPGALVTDVGSVKAPLAETLPGLLPRNVTYVGSHPMAGSHLRGLEAASADLFEGAPCVVMTDVAEAEHARICAFWDALGARVFARDPAVHDVEVAWVSHLPHVLAFAFANAFEAAPEGAGDVVGSGFRDFTRIGRSEPELWSDILTANGKALTAPLQAAERALSELVRLIEAGDAEALGRRIAAARATLSAVSREGRGKPEDSN